MTTQFTNAMTVDVEDYFIATGEAGVGLTLSIQKHNEEPGSLHDLGADLRSGALSFLTNPIHFPRVIETAPTSVISIYLRILS